MPEFAENITGPKFGPIRDLDVMSVVYRGEAARPDVPSRARHECQVIRRFDQKAKCSHVLGARRQSLS